MPELNEINDSLADFEKELKNIKSASELIENAKESVKKVMTETNILNDSANKLLTETNILMKKFDNVDFPSRLDKIDNSIISINTAIQNIFGRFDMVESNLHESFKSRISHLSEKFDKKSRKNSIFQILILLFSGSILVILLLKIVLPN